MPTDRLRGWLVTIVLTVIGGVVRLQNLAFPTHDGTPVFEKKYYAAQAWQMLRNGWYEDNPGLGRLRPSRRRGETPVVGGLLARPVARAVGSCCRTGPGVPGVLVGLVRQRDRG
jgi:hypothetical protein